MESDYSVDVIRENGESVHIGGYSSDEELDQALENAVHSGQMTQDEADTQLVLAYNIFMRDAEVMKKIKWILCPTCGNKTRTMIREDTELKNFLFFVRNAK